MVTGLHRGRFSKLVIVALLILGFVGLGTPASAATAGAWSTPDGFEVNTNYPLYSQVLADGQGNLTALWTENGGMFSVLHSSTKTVGDAWSPSVTLSPAGNDVTGYQLLMDNSGNLTAIWLRVDSPGFTLQSATKLQSGAWSSPVNISPVGQSIVSNSAVVDGLGNVTAVWSFFDGSNWLLRSSTKLFGGNWSNAVDISFPAASSVDDTELVADPQGTVTAVWSQHNSVNTVFSATRTSAGVWSTPQNLSAAGFEGYNPQMAIDSKGNVIAIWRFNDGSSDVVQSSTKPEGGSWAPARTEIGLGNGFVLIELASDSLGNLTLLGSDANSFTPNLEATSKSVGGLWSSWVALSDPSEAVYGAQLVVDQSGNASAIWQWGNGFPGVTIVQTATCPFGGSWSNIVNLSPASTSDNLPSLSLAVTGEIISSWSQVDISGYSLQYSTMAWNYTLTFSANTGSGSAPASQIVTGYSSTTFPSGSALTRSGYVFSGWNTRADGTGTTYGAGTSYRINADTTLYAKWTPELAATGFHSEVLNISAGIAALLLCAGLLLVIRRGVQL